MEEDREGRVAEGSRGDLEEWILLNESVSTLAHTCTHLHTLAHTCTHLHIKEAIKWQTFVQWNFNNFYTTEKCQILSVSQCDFVFQFVYFLSV